MSAEQFTPATQSQLEVIAFASDKILDLFGAEIKLRHPIFTQTARRVLRATIPIEIPKFTSPTENTAIPRLILSKPLPTNLELLHELKYDMQDTETSRVVTVHKAADADMSYAEVRYVCDRDGVTLGSNGADNIIEDLHGIVNRAELP